jgi:hypothetical protein
MKPLNFNQLRGISRCTKHKGALLTTGEPTKVKWAVKREDYIVTVKTHTKETYKKEKSPTKIMG